MSSADRDTGPLQEAGVPHSGQGSLPLWQLEKSQLCLQPHLTLDPTFPAQKGLYLEMYLLQGGNSPRMRYPHLHERAKGMNRGSLRS